MPTLYFYFQISTVFGQKFKFEQNNLNLKSLNDITKKLSKIGKNWVSERKMVRFFLPVFTKIVNAKFNERMKLGL
jgi:hypothetical protein